MTNILKGQRIALTALFENNTSTDCFQVDLQISGIKQPVDFSCFGLDKEQKLTNDAYMTFFNQPKTPCGAVELSIPSGDSAGFLCNLNKLPSTIDRLVFTAAIDGSETMGQIQTGYLRFLVAGKEIARFSFSGTDFQNEKALMLGELYRKEGAWRFSAVGQGFDGGLNALVKHFGGEVLEEHKVPPTLPPKVSLSKIILEKQGDKISLEKPSNSSGHGRIICNLNWTLGNQNKGFFGKSKGIDLDLGCLYELSNGTKHVVQALGNSFGSYDHSPYIHMAGDDRSGASTDGEFLYVNGNHLSDIKRICIFAFIYEGVVNWTQANAVVTITIPEQPVIEVRLDTHQSNSNMCAIAMLENNAGELKLTKLGKYFRGHQELDKHYKWGMRWSTGSK
jgi:tellurite resistance protein TerA